MIKDHPPQRLDERGHCLTCGQDPIAEIHWPPLPKRTKCMIETVPLDGFGQRFQIVEGGKWTYTDEILMVRASADTPRFYFPMQSLKYWTVLPVEES